jgi:hypothetical protein
MSTSTNTPCRSASSRKRFRMAIAACAGLAMLLSGCYRETVNVKISPRGKVSGILQFELNTQAAKELGMTQSDGDTASKSKKLPAGVTLTQIRNGNYEGFRYTMKNVEPQTLAYLMANLIVETEDDPEPVLVRNGDTWRFEMKNNESSSDSMAPSDESDAPDITDTSNTSPDLIDESAAQNPIDGADSKLKNSAAVLAKYPPRLMMSITFPGRVVEADTLAKVSGKTASWDITMTPEMMASADKSGELFAVGKAR